MSTPGVAPKRPSAQAARSRENTLVTIMFFAAGIAFLDRFGIAYAFPYIGPDLQLDNTQLGWTMSITALCWAVSSIVFSLFSDRLLGGRKKTIIVTSLVLFSLAAGAVGLAQNFTQLLVIRGIIGALEGPVLPLIQSAVAAASSEHRRGRNLGIVIAGTAIIGSALPPILVVSLSESLGWRAVFPLSAAPGLVIALLVAIFMKESRSTADAPEKPAWRDVGRVLVSRNVLLCGVAAVALIGFTLAFTSFAPLYLAQNSVLSSGTIATVLSLFGLGGALGCVIAPSWSDRLGRKPVFLLASLCTALVPIAILLLHDHAVPLLFSVLLQLLAAGALVIAVYAIPGESVPAPLAATTFAVLIALSEILGGGLAPAVAGALADGFGLSAAMWFCAGLGGLSLVAGMFVKETRPRRTRPDTAQEPLALAEESPPLEHPGRTTTT
ncbi:MFS transporter [Streptomyces sp. NPDC056296]|uniref:MFS transporter n=1 Tax=Streptomyces sp. NPDC056296 TaxID=3345775 RepID=UPI0035D570DE